MAAGPRTAWKTDSERLQISTSTEGRTVFVSNFVFDKKKEQVKKVKPVKKPVEEEVSDEGIDEDDLEELEVDSDTEDLGITEEFTDENAAWLKPSNKRKLLEDSDDED